MKEHLSNLKENSENGLREFSKHPLEHTSYAIRDFVADYWDLGAMVLAGFAFNDYGSEIFGEARFPIMFGSTAASLFRTRNDTARLLRNGYAGIASALGFGARGIDTPLSTEIINYTFATLSAAASLYLDGKRENKRYIPKPSSPTPSKRAF